MRLERANGDWFALDDHGRFRVLVFHPCREVMQSQARHPDMLRFRPTVIDEQVLNGLALTEGDSAVYFCLVDDPFAKLKRSRPVERTQLARLIQEPVANLKEAGRSYRDETTLSTLSNASAGTRDQLPIVSPGAHRLETSRRYRGSTPGDGSLSTRCLKQLKLHR